MKPIRIIDSNFNLVGELNNYISLVISRNWGIAGSIQPNGGEASLWQH